MNTLAGKHITVIAEGGGGDVLVSAIRKGLQKREETLQVRGVPLSELTPDNAGDIVVTTDGIYHEGLMCTDTRFIADVIRGKVEAIPLVIYMIESSPSLADVEKSPERAGVALLHNSAAFPQALRMVLGGV